MIKQRTIKKEVVVEGRGLQTGKKVTLRLHSSPPDSGINFIRCDLANKPLLNIKSLALDNTSDTAERLRRTVLELGPLKIQTTEHFLSALSALRIDNIVAEMDTEELPGMDGSAREFVEAIQRAGISSQCAPRSFLKITKPVWVEDGGSFIAIFPDDSFRVSYTLSYAHPAIGSQFLSLVVNEENFIKEIAPARTFCLEEEASELLKRGLGKGADYDNTLVMGKLGPVKTTLRFADEPLRHKILDLIGDLCLVGRPILGHVVAIKSGHAQNMELAKKLKSEGE